jgi:hypothetical protein
MAISYISSASAATTTVAMPTHQTGDLIIAFAYRDGNTTAPALPAGWTNIDNSGANTNSARLAYKIAASGSETTGTWTNATGIVVQVYRGASGVGASAVNGAASSTITYPALTLLYPNGSSWVARFAGHRTATNMTTNTPAGYTQRTGVATEVQGSDTNAATASNPTSGTQSVDASSGYRAYTLEIRLNAKMETFSDDFNDNSLNAAKWTQWTNGDVSETSQTLQIASNTSASVYKGMQSVIYSTLVSSYAHVEVPHAVTGLTSTNTLFQLAVDTQHTLTLYSNGTSLAAEYQINGTYTTPATTPYDPVAHRWWRIRESGGTIYYEYSSNANGWSVLASVAAPFAVTNMMVLMFVGSESVNTSTDTAVYDNFNVLPALFSVARGQYRNNQTTPIAVGDNTLGDGVANNIWLEAGAYSNTPSTSVTISVESQLVGTNFTGTASASKSLILKQANLPTSRRGSAMIYDAKNSRFILFGGYDGSVRFNEVWELSADNAYHRWKKLAPTGTAPVARNLCASTYARGTTSGSVDKAYMVIWGGADPNDRNDMLILDVSTPGSEAWTTVTQTNAPSTRDYITHHMAAKVTASNTIDIYLFGGWASSRVNDLNRCTLNVNSPGSVTWTTLKANGTAGNPSIRSGAAMIYDSLNDRLVITSGYNGSTYLSDVWQYSISGGTFTQLSPTGTAPGGRELPSIGYDSAHQRLILMGGWQGGATSNRNDIVQLSLTSGSEAWTQIKSNDLSNQSVFPFSNGAAAVDTNRNIMVVSMLYGYDSTDKYTYAFNMGDTSTSASLYSLTIADHFRARDAPAFVYNTARSEFLLINGYSAMDDDATISNGEHISEIWAYSQTNQTWRYAAKGPFNMTQCEGGLAVYDSANDRVIFFGGLRGTNQMGNDVWELKADAFGMYKATRLSPSGSLPPQRWLMAGCYDAANHRMVIWGGQNASTILSDTWALDLTQGSEAWTQLSPTGTAPTPVWQSSYVFDATTKRLYIHGGFTGAGYSSQLFYLNLSTTNGAWTNTSATGGVAVRGAVLGYDGTNQRLICFGGYDGTSVDGTVRYISTSSFGAWTTQSTANTPAARRSAGTAMIGSKFIVTCGRPVSGTWYSDTQELDTSVTPASWSWTARSPQVYQPVGLARTSLAAGSYHWQSWVTSGASASPYSSFGGNSESLVDFAVGNAGLIKVYDGSSWVWKPVKVWNGTSWVTKTLRYWDGTHWQPYTATVSPVTLDAIGPGATGIGAGSVSSLSWSHTCSGTNRYLVVSVAVGIDDGTGATTSTTATCNGSAMTSLGRQNSDNDLYGYVEMFGIIPPTGSCSIVVTANKTVISMEGGSISATSVDQSSPVRTAITNYGNGTSMSVVRTGATNDLFIDAACCGSGILTSLQTIQIKQNHDYSTAAGNLAMSTVAGSASATMGYTDEDDWWGIVAIALKPASS